ncbi:hypothetical protein [Streptomyces zagrosensis]|uniref:Uncharacterized protein n=1 Tax=Streptomyces zagrosensis TaxID=1042984 RepID=A0A7W9QGF2_9ACTN|nr:hypothetical protein [Streptomyces zagrosensis]MBB5939529.1 hypothetical protein [Streptomyces zagrosensis]
MGAINNFLEILSGAQLTWFKKQSMARQAAIAAQWQGSGKTPEDVIEDNGGPSPEGGREGIPEV